jgi:diguanylate cyclase (GGDEF)-like protein
MEVKLYFRMLQRSWWIIVLAMLSAAGVALALSYFSTPIYSASGRYIVSPNPSLLGEGSNVLYSLDTLDKRSIITTYSEILNSPRLYSDTVASMGLSSTDLVDYTYNAIVLPDTNIIVLEVQGSDPEIVVTLANNIGQRAVQYVEGLYPVYDMTLLDPASLPELPISPQPFRDSGIAAILGLAIGVAFALVWELLNAPIKNFMQQRNLDKVSLALNRTAFEEKLEVVAFASTKDFSLCMVHLGGLREYIGVLPFSTLEVILRHVNQVLRNQLRGHDLVGRWDDLDFIVLLSETPGNGALNTMARVQTALSVPIKINVSGEDLALDPKIGIAEYRVGDTSVSLVRNTNWALEIAKEKDGMYLLRATESI